MWWWRECRDRKRETEKTTEEMRVFAWSGSKWLSLICVTLVGLLDPNFLTFLPTQLFFYNRFVSPNSYHFISINIILNIIVASERHK